MTVQFDALTRNSMLEAYEVALNGQAVSGGTGAGGSVTGTAAQPRLRIFSGTPGTMPANTAAASTGTQITNDMVLPADWSSNASAGAKGLPGTWQTTGNAPASTGTIAAYYRIFDSAGTTCKEQGLVFPQIVLATNAVTAANGNVLNFAATTGVAVGMNASGTGVPAGATVVAVTATTVTLSMTSTAGVANAASITFNGDLTVDNASIANGQTITISSKNITAPNA